MFIQNYFTFLYFITKICLKRLHCYIFQRVIYTWILSIDIMKTPCSILIIIEEIYSNVIFLPQRRFALIQRFKVGEIVLWQRVIISINIFRRHCTFIATHNGLTQEMDVYLRNLAKNTLCTMPFKCDDDPEKVNWDEDVFKAKSQFWFNSEGSEHFYLFLNSKHCLKFYDKVSIRNCFLFYFSRNNTQK